MFLSCCRCVCVKSIKLCVFLSSFVDAVPFISLLVMNTYICTGLAGPGWAAHGSATAIEEQGNENETHWGRKKVNKGIFISILSFFYFPNLSA